MKIDEFFSILQDFSEEKLIEFKKFLLSPFFVNNKSLINTFDIITERKDLFKNSEYEKIFKRLSKKLKHSKSTIIYNLSFLKKATLNFIMIKALLNDKENSGLYLSRQLLNDRNFSTLENSLKDTERVIYGSNRSSEKFFLDSFRYNILRCDFITVTTRFANREDDNVRAKLLNSASSDLFLYTFIHQVNLFANSKFASADSGNYSKSEFPIDLSKIIQEFDKTGLFKKPLRKNIIYELHKSMFYTFYFKNNKKYYLEYKRKLRERIKYLDIESINHHYNMLINICVMKDKLEEEKDFFKKQKVELLFEYIRKDYFKTDDNEYLHPTIFRNFMLIVYSTGNYEQLKKFIYNYSKKLNLNDIDDMFNYGLTYYYYGIKNYEKVLEHIKKIEINDFVYWFDIRNIELRVYYESEDYDKLDDAIHNYRKTILDYKMFNKFEKVNLLKLLKYLNKLILVKTKPDINRPFEAGYLISLVDKEPYFALKNWLLERLTELVFPTKGKKLH